MKTLTVLMALALGVPALAEEAKWPQKESPIYLAATFQTTSPLRSQTVPACEGLFFLKGDTVTKLTVRNSAGSRFFLRGDFTPLAFRTQAECLEVAGERTVTLIGGAFNTYRIPEHG